MTLLWTLLFAVLGGYEFVTNGTTPTFWAFAVLTNIWCAANELKRERR